ncbi:hypothetical protein BpHYR1_011675 [Brachionus plicatilis]|uniref:Uncharacterized protein n=1 Tax=Brachionus plicatilis TaxID=10195 RepID=A0A3M7SJR9_BRAPC|nr:hypothetical protein BpHYR1_011675 [Brachionus plicatilis]
MVTFFGELLYTFSARPTSFLGFVKLRTKEQSFRINHVNAEWCINIHRVNSKSLLMMCKISAKCTSLDYIEI